MAKLGMYGFFNILVVVSKGWKLYQMNIHNALIYGDLENKVYMKLPYTYKVNGAKKVC